MDETSLEISCKNDSFSFMEERFILMEIEVRQPTLRDSLTKIKKMGVPINTILDVGVLNGTSELMQTFANQRHI